MTAQNYDRDRRQLEQSKLNNAKDLTAAKEKISKLELELDKLEDSIRAAEKREAATKSSLDRAQKIKEDKIKAQETVIAREQKLIERETSRLQQELKRQLDQLQNKLNSALEKMNAMANEADENIERTKNLHAAEKDRLGKIRLERQTKEAEIQRLRAEIMKYETEERRIDTQLQHLSKAA